jgi:hypothetical protein
MLGRLSPSYGRFPSCALIGGTCHSCGSGPPLAQRHIKGDTPGTQEPMFAVPTQFPTNPNQWSDHVGAEVRGRTHCAVTVTLLHRRRPTPTAAAAMSSSSLAQGNDSVIPRP